MVNVVQLGLSSLAHGDDHLDDRLGLIAAPSLVPWGQADTLTPVSLGHRIGETVPGARLVVLDDSAPSLAERRRQSSVHPNDLPPAIIMVERAIAA